MSASVFPTLPSQVLVKRSRIYKTTIHECASAREDRTSWAPLRYKWDLSFPVLRTTVTAPSPWGAYSEAGVVDYFFDAHIGTADSFHITDPYDGTTDRVVRFVEDSFDMVWVCNNIWEASFSLVSVV
jgi:hypothetical protein